MPENGTKDHLARIRDNQRRSRARRKEYLQELEWKYRNCEQLGVEASAEIQLAARRVLEENKRLRALLKQKGVPDEEIETFVDEQETNTFQASTSLENLLSTRKPCNGTLTCGSSAPQLQRTATSIPLDFISLGMVQMSTSPHPQTVLSPLNTDFPLTTNGSPLLTTNLIPVSQNDSAQNRNHDSAYPHHQELDRNGTIMPGPLVPESLDNDDWQHDVMADQTTSCVQAADMIRNMGSNIGTELEEELGCIYNNSNCEVKNNVVFDVMDKYMT